MLQRVSQLEERVIFMKADWPGILRVTFEKPIDFGLFFRMDLIGFSNYRYSVSDWCPVIGSSRHFGIFTFVIIMGS